MHIGLVGPVATVDIKHLLDGDITQLPKGYAGGPLLATLIGELLHCGHTVSVFTLSNDMTLQADGAVTATGNRFALHYVPMRSRAWRPNGWLPGRITDMFRFEIRELSRAILQVKPDVLHAHWVYEFALAAIETRMPHVITCHDSPYTIAKLNTKSRPTRSLYRWLRVLMARKTFKAAKYVTAVSPYMRDEVQAMTSTPIQVIPNPVDNIALSLARRRQVPMAPRLVMVCNGWDARKNPQPALMAFAELRSKKPGAELHLYGFDFGLNEKAESWCMTRKIQDGMVFHGAVSHRQLFESLAEYDLLLHPSLEESFGMVIAESMAMGLPVVAGESSGAVPWVVGEGGVLCDVRRADAIYRAIIHSLIPEKYAACSAAAQERVKSMFTANAVASAYLNMYQAAISQRVIRC